jgi:hypothetical protein
MRVRLPQDVPKKNPPSFRRALVCVAIFFVVPLVLIAHFGH